jgi:uncharacterized protein
MRGYNQGFGGQIVQPDMSVDAGLRGFMLGVYNKLALGLVLSAALAWVTGTYPPISQLFYVTGLTGRVQYTLLGAVIAWAPLALVLFQSFFARQSAATWNFTYWAIVSMIGASLGVVFKVYADQSVYETFLVTAGAFGGLSLYGYTTKRDLGPVGSFLIMGLIGVIIAMLVSLFFPSPAFLLMINVLGVLIFAGLIAYDTQNLKMMYYQLGGDEAGMSVATSYGALNLYLDFINLFRFLLALFGDRR